jgi:heme exporter protein D
VIDFIQMGGDGAYVWSAYGITLAVLIVNIVLVRARHRTALRRAREIAAQAEVPRRQPKVHRVQ